MTDANIKKTKKWLELSREIVFEKYGRGIEKVLFQLPNGKKDEFYIKKEKNGAGIVALTEDNKIILVKQFRPGPKKILLELPGGFVDVENKPKETIENELLEETGYIGKVKYVGSCIDDAYSNMMRYCFVATNCVKIQKQKLGVHEFAEVVLIPLDKFREHLRNGELTDVEIGYLGLDFLQLL